MKTIAAIAGILGFVICALSVVPQTYSGASYPQTEISNGLLRAKIYLPDAEKGFYRGLRFDWAGVIGSLKFKDHSYFSPFFEKFDPSVEDVVIGNPVVAGVNSAASGPVEEFIGADGTALGYSEAKPGETFCKIGVGSLRKPDNAAYSSYRIYAIVDGGKRTVKKDSNTIEFNQDVQCGSGYGYRYTKTIRLLKSEAAMTIEHRLVNIGKKAIETQVYDHNFLTIDHAPTGPEIVLSFPFSPHPTQKLSALAEIREKQLLFPKELKGDDTFYTELRGFGQSASDYQIRVENHKTGASVVITGDQPLANLGVWAVRTVVAPEPYMHIEVASRKEFSWKYTYTFLAAPR